MALIWIRALRSPAATTVPGWDEKWRGGAGDLTAAPFSSASISNKYSTSGGKRATAGFAHQLRIARSHAAAQVSTRTRRHTPTSGFVDCGLSQIDPRGHRLALTL